LSKTQKIIKIINNNMNKTWIIVILAIVVIGGIVIASSTSDNMKDADMMDDNKMMNEDMMNTEEGVMVGGAMMVESKDIVDNAVNASNVTTLVAAVQAAGLVETLKGPGPFTVFAPTNAAFDKLPAGTVDTLVMPENKEKLASILTYHVVAGAFTSADLKDGQMLTSVQGQDLKITKKNGKIMVNGSAMVETADVISSNGVTFVIDEVLMPTM